MTLARFFETIAPFLEGRMAHAQAAAELYGPQAAAGSVDAARLAIYGRFCRVHRFRSVDGIFGHCRTVILRHAGEAAWEALVEGYYRQHPMRHFELNTNAAALPSYLAGELEGRLAGCPAWLGELADFEWWEWQTRVSPDEPAVPAATLGIAPAVEVRPYGHDFVGWIDDGPGPDDGEPAPGPVHVVFWRDPEGEPRRDTLSPVELLALKWVFEGLPPLDEVLSLAPGLTRERLLATVEDLRHAGVLAGELPG